MYKPLLFRNHALRFARAEAASETAVVVCHGFPSQPFSNPKLEKNWDMSLAISKSLGIDTYLMHYRGLGKSAGRFSFAASIADTKDFISECVLSGGYSKVHLLGHSWGGYVAINAHLWLPESLRGAVALLSPLSALPNADTLAAILGEIGKETHIDYAEGDISTVVQDLIALDAEFAPRLFSPLISNSAHNVMILQATDDPVVPPDVTRAFLETFQEPPMYLEVATDHKFLTDRAIWTDRVVRFFGDWS